MHFLTSMCCICLKHEKQLQRLFNSCENLSYSSKLIELFPGMISTVLYNQGSICVECCSKVDDFYKFHEQCLQNSQKYVNYTSKLSSSSESNTELCVYLTDLKEEQKQSLKALKKNYHKMYTLNLEKGGNDDYSGVNINDETGCDMLTADTRENDITTEIDVKTDYEEYVEAARLENASCDSVESHCVIPADCMSQYNLITDFLSTIAEDIDSNSEWKDERDTATEAFSSHSYESCETVPVKKFKQINKTETMKTCYKCDICEEILTRARDLAVHKRVHTGDKPFKCDECDKAFTQSGNLTVHKRVHSGERPYKCEQCITSFSQKIQLINHIRVHTGEKPYKCDQCSKAFRLQSTFVRHKLRHSRKKPYKCDQCDEAFSVLKSLASHKRTHSVKKPYKCDQCVKAFANSSTLTKHKGTHFKDKHVKCDQ